MKRSLSLSKRPIFAARLVSCARQRAFALALFAVTLATGCPKPAAPTPPPREAAPLAPLIDVGGTWSWSKRSTVDAIERIESEVWTLSSPPDATEVSGHYVRRVEFVADDKAPFRCSQSSRFVLESRFELRGTRSSENVTIREVSATRVSSPCSPSTEAMLSSYELRRDDDGLVATSDAGAQRLRAAPTPETQNAPVSPAGSWVWVAVSEDATGVRRLERERWELAVNGDELIGTYTRHIRLAVDKPSALPCASPSKVAEWSDVYQIRGWIRTKGIEIAEQSVETTNHPCVPAERRHLDVATGRVYRDHLELLWRADRRHVLARPFPSSVDVVPSRQE